MANAEKDFEATSEKLVSAKNNFRKALLADDVSFEIVAAHLETSSRTIIDTSLPNFSIEPTLQRMPDKKSRLGLLLLHSARSKSDDVEIHTSLYDYLPLGELDRTTGDTEISPELSDLLTKISRTKEEAISILQLWQSGLQSISQSIGNEAMLDPISYTIRPRSEIESTYILPDEL